MTPSAAEVRSPGPAVSVILPTYQRRDLVLRAVASVLAQSFRDFELILIDGSLDGTREALAPLRDQIRYVWQPNRGVSAARNAALDVARGEFVAFLDSDNWWLPEHLAVIVTLLRRHPEAVLASTSAHYREDGHQPLMQARLVEPFPAILTRGLAGFVSSTAARRTEIEAAGRFDESLQVGEDTDLWLRLALRGQFVLLERQTAVIVRSPDSLSMRATPTGARLNAVAASLHHVEERMLTEGRGGAATKVHGARRYVEALELLAIGNASAVPGILAEACRLLPDLSQGWGYGLYLFGLMPSGPNAAARLSRLQTLATAWPDRGSPMSGALHARALYETVCLDGPHEALRWAARAPKGPLLRHAVRRVAEIILRRVQRLADPRREPVHLGTGWDVSDDDSAGRHER